MVYTKCPLKDIHLSCDYAYVYVLLANATILEERVHVFLTVFVSVLRALNLDLYNAM